MRGACTADVRRHSRASFEPRQAERGERAQARVDALVDGERFEIFNRVFKHVPSVVIEFAIRVWKLWEL